MWGSWVGGGGWGGVGFRAHSMHLQRSCKKYYRRTKRNKTFHPKHLLSTKIFSYTCPAFNFATANWYFYSQNTFPKSPTANGDESGEKCSVRKTKHMFHIKKKKILNMSLSIRLSIQSPKEKEVRKLTAYLVNGRLRDLLSTPPGVGSYSPTWLESAPRVV